MRTIYKILRFLGIETKLETAIRYNKLYDAYHGYGKYKDTTIIGKDYRKYYYKIFDDTAYDDLQDTMKPEFHGMFIRGLCEKLLLPKE